MQTSTGGGRAPARRHLGSPRGLRGFRWLILTACVTTYLLIVLGGVVRITGSGMGCGDEWPMCNGRWFPPMDLATFIEWSHRLVAAGVGAIILAAAAWAWWPGRGRRWRGLRLLGAAAVVLLAAQVMLGAVTVWLELPPASVILHKGTAMALFAVLLVAACRGAWWRRARRPGAPGSRWAWAGAGLAFVTVLAGALTANLDAASACLGFPLCSGAWLPAESWRAHVHWTHRLLAYGLVGWAVALPALTGRWRPADGAARAWAWTATGAVCLQLGVAVAMVLLLFPTGLRAAHVAAGSLAFAALAVHAWLLSHPDGRPGRGAEVEPIAP